MDFIVDKMVVELAVELGLEMASSRLLAPDASLCMGAPLQFPSSASFALGHWSETSSFTYENRFCALQLTTKTSSRVVTGVILISSMPKLKLPRRRNRHQNLPTRPTFEPRLPELSVVVLGKYLPCTFYMSGAFSDTRFYHDRLLSRTCNVCTFAHLRT